MRTKRVHELITCTQFQNDEYDESRHGGHAAEVMLAEVLSRYGFEAQKEVEYKGIVGHPDFVRIADHYIEFIEVKNTGQASYSHVLQASIYKALLHKVYSRPVVGYLLYVKFRTVLGDSPITPRWVQDLGMQYIFLPVDSGENYINWALFRTSYRSKLAGPYCVYCRDAECKIRYIIINGPSSGMLDQEG
jgi:hypothetical protein